MSRGMVGEMLLKFPSYNTSCVDPGTEEITKWLTESKSVGSSLWYHILEREWSDDAHRPMEYLP
jgi:hypothetical protein